MTLLDIQTFTFSVRDGFQVDIVSTEKEYSAWIYHKDYGIKSLMWAEPHKQPIEPEPTPISKFVCMASEVAEEAIADYKEEYMD